jgi:hypothetical protein
MVISLRFAARDAKRQEAPATLAGWLDNPNISPDQLT